MTPFYPNDFTRDLATVRHIRLYPDLSDRERSLQLGVGNRYVGDVKRRMARGDLAEEAEVIREPASAVTNLWDANEWAAFNRLRDAGGVE